MEDPGKHNRNLWHWKFWAGILRGAIKAVLFTIAYSYYPFSRFIYYKFIRRISK